MIRLSSSWNARLLGRHTSFCIDELPMRHVILHRHAETPETERHDASRLSARLALATRCHWQPGVSTWTTKLHFSSTAGKDHVSSRADDKKDSASMEKPNKVDWDLVKDVSLLSGSQLFLNMGFSQIVPVMPLFAAEIGGAWGASGIGLIVSAPALATFILNVPLGRLCDTIGRKPLMYSGTAATAIGSILTGFSGGFWSLFACRMLVGSGITASGSGSQAYMADLTDRAPKHRAKIMGLNNAIAGSVWVIGPAVGGWLAETYGIRNSFFIAGVGSAICCLGYTQLPETLKMKTTVPTQAVFAFPWSGTAGSHVQSWWDDMRPLLESPNQQALIAMSIVPSLRWSCFTTVVALHATATVAAGPQQLGLMFTALALSQGISMTIGSFLADKCSGARKELVLPAGLTSCAAFASIAFASSLDHFYIAMAMQGFCAGFNLPAQGAFRAEVTPQKVRGQAMSLERQAGSMIGLAGPITWGLLADLTSCPTAILFTSSLMVTCHLAYWLRAMSPTISSKS
eukprot:TRINITY_DN74225_c0_g1_i1.p1 TRINITY_DN74225_c0_g1~~TRINITY_DN74225_c0_g1_i1.p1  ORF type:complete len:515 (-),score=71.95 TRINITY_DN74225_c0_g1_i1:97-1641(-)